MDAYNKEPLITLSEAVVKVRVMVGYLFSSKLVLRLGNGVIFKYLYSLLTLKLIVFTVVLLYKGFFFQKLCP